MSYIILSRPELIYYVQHRLYAPIGAIAYIYIEIVDNASLQADTLKTITGTFSPILKHYDFPWKLLCLSKSCKYLISEVVLRSLYDFHSLWIMTFLMAKMTVGIYFQQKAVLLLIFVY